MQTSKETIALAGTQIPLLHEDQIVPGALLAGVVMAYVWEVMGLDGRHALIRKLPATTPVCHGTGHTFAAYGRGHVCSTCQLRKEPLIEFLPKREEKARVHIIQPSGRVQIPQPYTVYGYLLPNKTVQTVHLTGATWNQSLPVIPTLSIVWTIPESLRAMVSSAPTPEVE